MMVINLVFVVLGRENKIYNISIINMQRAASVQIETVAEFKAHVKALLKES